MSMHLGVRRRRQCNRGMIRDVGKEQGPCGVWEAREERILRRRIGSVGSDAVERWGRIKPLSTAVLGDPKPPSGLIAVRRAHRTQKSWYIRG